MTDLIAAQKNWIEENPLRKFRVKNGASIMDTASLLGVSMSSIQQWETGAGYPRSDKFEVMGKLMNRKPAKLTSEWQKWYEGRPSL